MRRLALALALFGLSACAGEPDLAASRAGLELVPRAAWERAPSGCEDIAGRLAAVEGEPALGALLDRGGRAVCVDALWLLARETRSAGPPVPWELDPTPTPMTED